MFCDRCGAAIQVGQGFCNQCGKQMTGALAAMPPFPGRVQSHIHLVAILWFALSALEGLGGLFLLILGTALFPHLREIQGAPPEAPTGFLTALFTMLGIIVLTKAAAGFAAGIGLTKREPWGRMLALVMSFISLISDIPLGLALGVYTMWVLLPADSQIEYDAMAAMPH